VKAEVEHAAVGRAEHDLPDRRALVVDEAGLGEEPCMVEGARTLQPDFLLRREDELDARVRKALAQDAPRRLQHHRDRGLVVRAEDRPARVADDAVLDHRLERAVERDRVRVCAEEDGHARVTRGRQAAVDVPGARVDLRPRLVLLPLEAELGEVGADTVGHVTLVSRRARDGAELEEEVEERRAQLRLRGLHARKVTRPILAVALRQAPRVRQSGRVPEDHFGEAVAAHYDETSDAMFAPAVVDPVVDFLVELAGDGAALELGIGTGRIALPLSQRGVHLHGIDLSEAMVARLRAKPGADRIGVTIGDFATASVEGTFSVVYLVFNTIGNLTTQDEQVACFRNAAAHLEPGGCFVIEVDVPDLQRLPRGERFCLFDVSASHIGIDEYDLVDQGLVSHHYQRNAGGSFEYSSGPFRYVWPSELDLMARIAGLTLRERFGDWTREPFTNVSTKHVSVWEKPR
jgi:SAM-dependent methyltransferase